MPFSRDNLLARSYRLRFGLLMLIAGSQAIVAQSLLLREACVLMSGSELAWGIVLFAWLMGIAMGVPLGGRLARCITQADLVFVALLIGMDVFVGTSIWLFRGARVSLGVGPGEMLSPASITLAALVLVTPCSLLVGAMFPVASSCKAAACGERVGLAGSLGGIYAWESTGSLIAGAVFSFWAIEHLQPPQIVLACLCIAAVGSAVVAWLVPRRRNVALIFMVLAAIAGGVAGLAGDEIDRALVQRRWRQIGAGYELVGETSSRYQNLALGRREQQFSLFCDGQVSASFPDPWTYAPMTHLAMCQHPSPQQVLIIGGGAEGMLADILKHPVKHVDYVEPDPKALGLIAPYLGPAERAALVDVRVTIHTSDARYYIKSVRNRYDLVIARLPEPMSSLQARFYTADFYRELRAAMSDRGVLFMTAAAAPTTLGPAAGSYLASIRAMLREQFAEVVVGWGDPAIVLTSTANGLIATDPTELTRRYVSRSIHSDYFDPAWFQGATDMLNPEKIRQRETDLNRFDHVQISTDLHAAIYLQRLVMWEQATAGTRHNAIQWLSSIRLSRITGMMAAVLLAMAMVAWQSRKRAASMRRTVVFSIGTTGFATMALSIVWLFAFQSLYGYVYQRIGWIVALFMGGLVIGALWGKHRGQRFARQPMNLIHIDASLAALSLAAPFVLYGLKGMDSALLVEIAISALVTLTGVLGGAAFAVAGDLMGTTTPAQTRSTATWIVWADHLGAAGGALVTGVFLVPVYGIPLTALGVAIIKIVAVVLLVFVRPDRTGAVVSN